MLTCNPLSPQLRHKTRLLRSLKQFALLTLACISLPSARGALTDGLVGYWPFDGNGGDASSGGRDLTIFGNATFTDGLFGGALDLHGIQSQYAGRTIDDDIFDFSLTDFTVQIWANFYSFSREQTLIEKLDGSRGPGWSVSSNAGGATAHFRADDIGIYGSSPNLTTGTWRQFVVRRRGQSIDVIYDGAVVASESTSLPILDTGFPLLIGRRNSTDGRDFSVDGRLDEAAIWGRALTDGEIETLYNGGLGNPIAEGTVPPPRPRLKYIAAGDEWRYVNANDATLSPVSTVNFASSNYDDSSWFNGSAPFGNVLDGEFGHEFGTNWVELHDLYLRKTITLATPVDMIVNLGVDNGYDLYVNGMHASGYYAEGYTSRWEYSFSIPSSFFIPGENVIALALKDNGGATAFDMEMTGPSPVPEPSILSLASVAFVAGRSLTVARCRRTTCGTNPRSGRCDQRS